MIFVNFRVFSGFYFPFWGYIGMAVDPADEELVAFYAKYGFRRVDDDSLRMFLPLDSLC